jgi:hypothetical protein
MDRYAPISVEQSPEEVLVLIGITVRFIFRRAHSHSGL